MQLKYLEDIINWSVEKAIPIYLNLAKSINLKEEWDKLISDLDIKNSIPISALSKK